MKILETIAQRISAATGLPAGEVAAQLTPPKRPENGDYAFACFPLAKTRRGNPAALAQELSAAIKAEPPIASVEAAGPYLNFRVERAALIAEVLDDARSQGPGWGRSDAGRGRTIIVEYSSPNIAKHLGVHHLRSAAIGRAICNLHDAAGWKVISLNHLGDWGTSFGQLICAYKRWGEGKPPEELTVDELQRLYIRFHAEAKAQESLLDEARAWFQRLEAGDAEARRLWQCFKDASLKEYERFYNFMGIRFDRFTGESGSAPEVDACVERVKAALAGRKTKQGEDVCRISDNALIVDLSDDDMPPLILQKSDGSSIYASRDLATAELRHREFGFDRCVYVVGSEQKLYFRQVFRVLEMMGYEWARDCVHVDFGLIKFKDAGTGEVRKASTRRGEIVMLEDVLDEAVSRAAAKIRDNKERFEESDDQDAAARAIGLGAVVFGDLNVRRAKDVIFDWDSMMDFEGDTGPYVQYAHARVCSILRRYGAEVPAAPDAGLLKLDDEFALAKEISRFPEVVKDSAQTCEPCVLAGYLLKLCAAFGRYYNLGNRDRDLRALCDDPGVSAARVALVDAARRTISNGLGLLGISAPEKM
ncbi:MAG TPA: arginine--tRNA ligase [Candidatus Brocadiia bacterium]|nr:arginine--tRNA ligase [Candidatus Brocadiia bacterium]